MSDIIYSLLLLINISLLSALGLGIYLKNRRNVFNQVLSFSMLWLVFWMVSFFARYSIIPFALSVTKAQFFYWAKVSHYTGIFLVAFLSYFLIIFPDRKNKPVPGWFTILWLIIIPAIIGVLTFFNLMVKDMHQIGKEYFVVAGPFQPLFLFICAVYLLYAIVVIIRKYPRLTGLQSMQAKYVGIGLLGSALFIIATNVLFPTLTLIFPALLRFSGIYRFAPLYSVFFFCCAAYTIMKHRLLDLELVVSRSVGYVVATAIVISGYILIVAFTEQFLRGLVGYGSFLVSSVSALIIAFIFHPLQSAIHNLIYNKFFAMRFTYQKFLLQTSQTIVTILNLEDLINYFVDIVQKHLGTTSTAFLLRNEKTEAEDSYYYYIHTYRGMTQETASKFQINNGLISWFYDTRQVFVKDEAELEMAGKRFSALHKQLDQIDAEILVPIFTKDKLAGILAMDRKTNGRIYSQTDIDILNILSAQVGVAIDNARLYGEAITDSLTGLFNRRYFDYRIQEEILRAQRYKRSLSLLMIDIDKFKEVNDKYGHPAGDFILKNIAKIIRASLRQIDIVCRYGGEEFTVILPETGKESVFMHNGEFKTIDACRTIAERIRQQVQKYDFSFAGNIINITVSVGMVYYGDAEAQKLKAENIIERADQALYQAKQAGRNCVQGLI